MNKSLLSTKSMWHLIHVYVLLSLSEYSKHHSQSSLKKCFRRLILHQFDYQLLVEHYT